MSIRITLSEWVATGGNLRRAHITQRYNRFMSLCGIDIPPAAVMARLDGNEQFTCKNCLKRL